MSRTVIYSMSVSLDGFISGPDGEIDWAAPDDELMAFHNEQTRQLGAHLCGRGLYEDMLPWETREGEFAQRRHAASRRMSCAAGRSAARSWSRDSVTEDWRASGSCSSARSTGSAAAGRPESRAGPIALAVKPVPHAPLNVDVRAAGQGAPRPCFKRSPLASASA
jgi:hypothetical protein